MKGYFKMTKTHGVVTCRSCGRITAWNNIVFKETTKPKKCGSCGAKY